MELAAERPATKVALHRSRMRSVSSAITRSSSIWWPVRSTSCSPTRNEMSSPVRAPTSTPPSTRSATHVTPGLPHLRVKEGSLLVTADEIVEVEAAEQLGPVVDTTGAGDQYAAGVLYGLWPTDLSAGRGRSHLGSLAAAEVISHVGPRPELRPLRELI